jgi:hypothetical protein
MALFTPPPPKAVPPMPVVAPYVSDADTRKKLWELGMRHHLKALEGRAPDANIWGYLEMRRQEWQDDSNFTGVKSTRRNV